MRKILVAVFICISAVAYAQVRSYYQFVDSRPITEAPLIFNCVTSTPNLICPGFVQIDPQGNATTAYNVLPVIAGQWSLGATGAAVPTTATYNAALSRGTEPGPTSGGNLQGLLADLVGKLVNQPYAPRELAVQGGAVSNGSGALTLIAAPGSGVKIYTTSIECGRDDAGTTAITLTIGDIRGTQMVLPNSGGGGGNNMTFPVPLVTTANTALQITPSAAVSFLRCAAQGFTGY